MKKDKNDYSEEYVKAHRTFPVANTVLLVICVIVQIAAVILSLLYTPVPQDLIKEYKVTVSPRDDGTLDVEYYFLWQPLDTTEPLTWVEIGMANPNFSVYRDSVSDTVKSYQKYTEDDYVSFRIDLARPYYGGETVEFFFKINQKDILCNNQAGYFYEFVPGWFNAIPVEHYEFSWLRSDDCKWADDARSEADRYVWSGSFDCGGYQKMYVGYGTEAFDGSDTVKHRPFRGDGSFNELKENKAVAVIVAIVFVCVIAIAEVYIIDSYVSYGRGRGFLVGYGHRVHVYGRANPHYVREREKHAASSSRGSGGRGCACACACACAGGGRAGCSAKNLYGAVKLSKEVTESLENKE